MIRLLAALTISLAISIVGFSQQPKKGAKKDEAQEVFTGNKPESASAVEFKPSELTKLAVIVSVGGDRANFGRTDTSDQPRLVEDVFLECLLAKGYTIASRSDVAAVLREKNFQESGATDDLAKSVGKVLNVPAVLIVRVTQADAEQRQGTVSGRVALGARLVSVESGSILWSGTHTNRTALVSRTAVGPLLLGTTAALAEAFPTKPGSTASAPRSVSPKDIRKLAVITVGSTGRPGFAGKNKETPQSNRQRQVEDVLVQSFIQKGYSLVSRSDIQALAAEQQFQKSGLTEDNAVAVGKLLNVPAVLLVGINDFASESATVAGKGAKGVEASRVGLGARLVDVATGEVRWSHAEYRIQATAGKGDADDLLATVAKDLAQFMPPDPDTPRGLLERAERLDLLGQTTAAVRWYKHVVADHASKPEGKKASARLKSLGNR